MVAALGLCLTAHACGDGGGDSDWAGSTGHRFSEVCCTLLSSVQRRNAVLMQPVFFTEPPSVDDPALFSCHLSCLGTRWTTPE